MQADGSKWRTPPSQQSRKVVQPERNAERKVTIVGMLVAGVGREVVGEEVEGGNVVSIVRAVGLSEVVAAEGDSVGIEDEGACEGVREGVPTGDFEGFVGIEVGTSVGRLVGYAVSKIFADSLTNKLET